MIDSHCHFDLPAFVQRQQQVLDECSRKGIERLLVPGLSVSQFDTILDLQTSFAGHTTAIDLALGCHPYFLQKLSDHDYDDLVSTLEILANNHQSDFIAIGECGLDGSLEIDITYQRKVLNAQIKIASALKKPLVLHHRQSHNELIQVLKQHKFRYGGVIHAFSGSLQIAKTYIDMGFYLGVGGTITYERAVKTRNTIAQIPLERILLETDAPDMPLCGFQGEDNSPTQLPLVAKALARLKELDIEQVVSTTTQNYKKLFLPC